MAGGVSKQPAEHSEWTSLFDDVLDPSTGLPLMGQPVMPLSPRVPVGMDGWVLEETKKLEAQQRIQQRKLLDLKQVCLCMYVCIYVCAYVCLYACVCVSVSGLCEMYAFETGVCVCVCT